MTLQALEGEVPLSAGEVTIMVNWMHAASHDMSCQLENSGRFREGAGFVVGEQSEQLWAMTKVSAVGYHDTQSLHFPSPC